MNENINKKIAHWCVEYPIRTGVGMGVIGTLVAFSLLNVLVDNYNAFGLLGLIGTIVLWTFCVAMGMGLVTKGVIALGHKVGILPESFSLSITGANDDLVDQLFITIRVLGEEHGLKFKGEFAQTVDMRGRPTEDHNPPFTFKNRQLAMTGRRRQMSSFRTVAEERMASLGVRLTIEEVS